VLNTYKIHIFSAVDTEKTATINCFGENQCYFA
jgi:hypothetical protein